MLHFISKDRIIRAFLSFILIDWLLNLCWYSDNHLFILRFWAINVLIIQCAFFILMFLFYTFKGFPICIFIVGNLLCLFLRMFTTFLDLTILLFRVFSIYLIFFLIIVFLDNIYLFFFWGILYFESINLLIFWGISNFRSINLLLSWGIPYIEFINLLIFWGTLYFCSINLSIF